jgi:pectate lyase
MLPLLTIIYNRTTGGKGGTVTTVSTLAQFTAAADNSKNNDITPRIIVVSGTISGAVQVRIGSNKTIIGLPGASKFDCIYHFKIVALKLSKNSAVLGFIYGSNQT